MLKIYWNTPSDRVFINDVERLPRNELAVSKTGDYLSLRSPMLNYYVFKEIHYTEIVGEDEIGFEDVDLALTYIDNVITGDKPEVVQNITTNITNIYPTTIDTTETITEFLSAAGYFYRDLTEYTKVSLDLTFENLLLTSLGSSDKIVIQYFDEVWLDGLVYSKTDFVEDVFGDYSILKGVWKIIPPELKGNKHIRLVSKRSQILSFLSTNSLQLSFKLK